MIRVRFRLGTLRLRGDAQRLERGVRQLREDTREGNARLNDYEAALRRARSAFLRAAERALLGG